MAHTYLVIIVSDVVRRSGDYLGVAEDQKDVLSVGDKHLTVQKEFPEASAQWTGPLGNAVLDRINQLSDWRSAAVRIAAHVSTCFEDKSTARQMKDQHFPAEETLIQRSLGSDFDLQVWGFHHDDPSQIWGVVSNIKGVIDSGDEARKFDFFKKLEDVFQQQLSEVVEATPLEEARKIWEELSVIRHEIIGLFDPPRLRLESAREREPDEAAKIRTSVESSLETKREKAQRLLAQSKRFAPGQTSEKIIADLQTHLTAEIDLQRFSEWLRVLDEKLNHLRSTATGLRNE